MKKMMISFALVGLILTSCETKKEETVQSSVNLDSVNSQQDTIKNDSIVATGDNSKTSVDWVGKYEGTLPCADCEGIKTTLTLNKDETYSLSQEYLNKNLKLEDKGKLQWSKDGGSIKITTEKNGRFNYKVGENRLFSLDQEGKEITGPLTEHYMLTKK